MHKFDINDQPIMFTNFFYRADAVHSHMILAAEKINSFFFPGFQNYALNDLLNFKELKCGILFQVNTKIEIKKIPKQKQRIILKSYVFDLLNNKKKINTKKLKMNTVSKINVS